MCHRGLAGAANRILSIDPIDLPRGVVAFSSGNHAQATAIVAQQVGAPANSSTLCPNCGKTISFHFKPAPRAPDPEQRN
jgi:hypothetical protein